MSKRPPIGETDIIIEFWPIGNVVKVSAIDPITLTEVSIVGPAEESRETLKRNAVKKLYYVLNKKKKPPSGGDDPTYA